MTGLTAVSLFAGIGGFDEALRRAGARVAASVEIDPACRGVLRRHFPESKIFDDVSEVDGGELRAAGLVPGWGGVVTAGWPCQGNSVAGRRAGLADARSGLWRHVVRLLAEARPRWFVGENVPGLLSVNGGRDFGAVVRDLDELGYGVAWRVLDAQWFGVPQRRRRVFLVGCLGDPAGPVEVLLEPDGSERDPAEGREARPGAARSPSGGAGGSRTVGTLGTSGPGGGWRVGADEAAAGQLVAATLQGGGRRGHRVDAEGAAGGHLVTAYNVHAAESCARERHAYETGTARCLDTTGGFASNQGGTLIASDNSAADTLRSHPRPGSNSFGAITSLAVAGDFSTGEDIAQTVRSAHGQPGNVADATAVRRLTPLECERLQGFPDDWTRWLDDGSEQSDSARYRQCGNAIAVPVAEWIARRLVAVDQASAARGAA